jgi:Ca2+-binding EF-hand superfamily protein
MKGMSVKQLHEDLDEDGDGNVDRREFLTRMVRHRIDGINPRDLGNIFDALDLNGDGVISPEEFQLYLKGANKSREQRAKDIDP